MASLGHAEVVASVSPEFAEILTPEALSFISFLHTNFEERRQRLLQNRIARQRDLDNGAFPDFLPETVGIRLGNWTVAPIPRDLQDRRVEITGPVDRKMVINALNSGASCFMADFEDSHAPSWEETIHGQINLRDAVNKTISFVNPQGKRYQLDEKIATLLVRPRGWHLNEAHVIVDGKQISGSLFDFGLFFFHNARALIEQGSGPYFYLPKMESHLEARLWNDVFNASQDYIGIPRGTVRATVLIETILAAFEMDEILFELRDHSAGLNCGRWDYIFSFIKKFRNHPEFILPDRSQITMAQHFMASYVKLLIRTCHRRGIHAMGGMAAQIPVRDDKSKNDAAIAKVRADKQREVSAGHDGTWVAHPGLVPIAKAVFDEGMKAPNQIDYIPQEGKDITAQDLLMIPEGTISLEGLRDNIRVGIQYMESWLRAVGCVPINYLMEDAATAEISRSQVWQWLKHGAKTISGQVIDRSLVERIIREELSSFRTGLGSKFNQTKFEEASQLMAKIVFDEELADFLTLVCYPFITSVLQRARM